LFREQSLNIAIVAVVASFVDNALAAFKQEMFPDVFRVGT